MVEGEPRRLVLGGKIGPIATVPPLVKSDATLWDQGGKDGDFSLKKK